MRIGVLISGRGSNMAAITKAVQAGAIPDSEVAVVISDKSAAPGLEKAAELGVETAVITRKGRPREEHDAEIVSVLKAKEVDLVCLAGYMRLLSPSFVRQFPNRILNIHPSLLPSFKGLDAQKQAVDYGVKVSGCTVHFVDEELDHGAIVVQKTVPVLDGDSPEELSERILEIEHETYVEAVIKITEGGFRIEGRRVIFGS
ncbi:MAG TPA: phosphoribosylglycinamide formyltransferase [Aridibacter sp.]|nr:phosphoribosylglycinamide formyltransferase [Aridibacter sp.]